MALGTPHFKASVAQEIRKVVDTDPYMDFTRKFLAMFDADLQNVADTGLCPLALFVFVLVLRSQLPSDTQDIEGMNSILQWMTKVAPTIKKSLV